MSEEQRPLLRIVRGTPEDVELAALTAVIAGLSAAGPVSETPAPRGRWADRAALTRSIPACGPGAWRASGFPR
jgi:hypothetical protein